MFIAMNRFNVPLENAEAFEAQWLNRDSQLDQVPGFVAFNMLKGPEAEGRRLYASQTTWATEADFTAWTQSPQFRAAHARAGDGPRLQDGPPRFEGFTIIQNIRGVAND